MSVDSRAYAWCNLGPLADGSSVADSHVQTAGVVTCRGTINLAGVYRPAPGTVVRLAYSDGQSWLARLPVRLLVLSSFANPLGGKTTSVSVGCDLTYFDNRKQPPTSLTTRQANPDTPEAVWRAAAPAIPASWLVEQILSALGLTAVGSIPLTNHYTRQEFDLTAGYVEELGKLCQSEGYVARMTVAGQVEFISKDQGLGTSVLLTEDDLIDLNPINTGELPGDSVYAKYTTLKLRPPDDPTDQDSIKKRNWEKEVTVSGAQQYIHNWTNYQTTLKLDSNGQPVTKQRKNSRGFPVYETNSLGSVDFSRPKMDPVYETKAGQVQERIGYVTRTTTETTYDSKDRAIKRASETLGLWGVEYSETYFFYSNGAAADGSDDELIREQSIEFAPLAPMKMSVGYQQRYSDMRGLGLGAQFQSGIRQTVYEKDKASGITKTTTTSFVPYINTTFGAESIARMRDNADERYTIPGLDPLAPVLAAATQLVSAGSEIRIRTEREYGVQRRPSEAERTASANQKAPNVEQTAESVWAVGSAASQTQVELSPPYAPDDRIVESGGVYSVIKSDAEAKALAYARIENRLLLGHRNGVGIQVLPELLPPVPLGLVYIRLNGATAAFRINGTTWNLDPQGVTATTDALFWGAIDGAVADAWFPLPPGIASLPAPVAVATNGSPKPANAAAIPNGFSFTNPNLTSLFAALPAAQAPVFARTVTPGVLIKPWTETTSWKAGAGAGVIVTTQPWIPQTNSLLVGAGAGARAALTVSTAAGTGAGVIAQSVRSTLVAGTGAGVITTTPATDAPMVAFTGGTAFAWDPGIYQYGMVFTLASPKTIKAVGFYDHNGDGLVNRIAVDLVELSAPGGALTRSLDAAGTYAYNEVPSGTAAPLVSGWRKVTVPGGRTLAAGTYELTAIQDPGTTNEMILKAATGVAWASGVSFVENRAYDNPGNTLTVSGDGVAYFGLVLFF